MSLEAQCPGCGAPIRFRAESGIVTVCSICKTVVGRGDKSFEDLGKSADLIDSASPLTVGLLGLYQGKSFELTGRVQYRHAAGGHWDEWYAHFADDRWGWLAEAQGSFILSFAETATELPGFASLAAGASVRLPDAQTYSVSEKGHATTAAGQGEIPYRMKPAETLTYVDLSGPDGRFATIDYSDTAVLYLGKTVTLGDLGLARAPAAEVAPKHVAAAGVTCPNCGGALELHAPDQAQRVVCPFCRGVLDANQGKLSYLKALEKLAVTPTLALGSTCNLPAGRFTVVGFLLRSVVFDRKYTWEEFLLYQPTVGFRWLVQSDGHWSWVEPVSETLSIGQPRYAGRTFRRFQDAKATCDYVLGEFYWRVEQGEQVHATDYVAPPLMLSREVSTTSTEAGDAEEVIWSCGSYLRKREVEKAFGIKLAIDPVGVAPNQPYRHGGVAPAFGLLMIAILIGFMIIAALRTVHDTTRQTFTLDPVATKDDTRIAFSQPFTLAPHRLVQIETLASGLSNSWAYCEGDLIDEAAVRVVPFANEMEYYFGVEDGEAWTEGSGAATAELTAQPGGPYSLRLECQWQAFAKPLTITATITQGGIQGWYLLIALSVLGLPALIVVIHKNRFEHRRWDDSNVETI